MRTAKVCMWAEIGPDGSASPNRWLIALLLIVAGNTARGQDDPTPPPGVLADFVLSEVEFRGRVNVGLAEIEEKTGLKKGADPTPSGSSTRSTESASSIEPRATSRPRSSLSKGRNPARPASSSRSSKGQIQRHFDFTVLNFTAASDSDSQLNRGLGYFDIGSNPPRDAAGASLPKQTSPPLEIMGLKLALPAIPDPVVDPTRLREYNEHLERADQARQAGEWKKATQRGVNRGTIGARDRRCLSLPE